jgi:hypothetical protein
VPSWIGAGRITALFFVLVATIDRRHYSVLYAYTVYISVTILMDQGKRLSASIKTSLPGRGLASLRG